ncbi:tannase and feruloyl esterase [Hypoxylon rubiginosum]|uniref:Tannase and feruloyl esterase n=1 Tax=Hypoxylon rubiginosum TaxID=110542 RepID=A0ACC0CTG5_9PEZI|nr:tannase and feruloyl esterase [Hypoxylon rubiginosum]
MRLYNNLFPALVLTRQARCAYIGARSSCTLDDLSNQLSLINSSLSHNATIISIVPVQLNSSYGDSTVFLGVPLMVSTGLPDLCAVEVNVTSSDSSSYMFSLFLPFDWNSRFLTVGGGRTGGYINYLDMGVGTHYGFATMSTDNGHMGSPYDIEWVYKCQEKEIDWGYRAMHGSVELAKDLIKGYYGEDIKYSYYCGCSTGGRQGLKEAHISADSFDGMLIGAAAWWASHQVSWITKISKDYFPIGDPKSILAGLFSSLVYPSVVEQCDEVDGVKDGIVSSPESCHPDFEVLSCEKPGANSSACLTDAQLETLGKIYADYYVGPEFVHPALELSSETGWSQNLFGSEPLSFGVNFIRYAVFEDLNWPLDAYNDTVYEYIKNLDIMHAIDADEFDMSPYRDQGGKILMYDGLSDPLIVTRGSSSTSRSSWRRACRIPSPTGSGFSSSRECSTAWAHAGQNWLIGSDVYSVSGSLAQLQLDRSELWCVHTRRKLCMRTLVM